VINLVEYNYLGNDNSSMPTLICDSHRSTSDRDWLICVCTLSLPYMTAPFIICSPIEHILEVTLFCYISSECHQFSVVGNIVYTHTTIDNFIRTQVHVSTCAEYLMKYFLKSHYSWGFPWYTLWGPFNTLRA